MTSDGILLTREPLMLDRKEEMLAGWQAAIEIWIPWLPGLGLPPGGELGFPVRWDGGSTVHGYPPLRADAMKSKVIRCFS